MEFIRSIREKYATQRQDDIAKEAERLITIQDFANTLYIAYNGTPLVEIEASSTPKDIVQQLSVVRNNYINSKSEHPQRVSAVL